MGPGKQKWLAMILLIIAIISMSVGTVFAYLSTSSNELTNNLSPDTETQPSIAESFQENIKRDVRVDVGDPGYPVYVRAAIVATWQSSMGNVHWQVPTSAEYIMNWNSTDWFYNEKDGFYYLKTMVFSGETPNLINLCYQTQAGPTTGYQLHIEVIAQTIQALGTTDNGDIPAVTDAWGIAVDENKNLVEPTT